MKAWALSAISQVESCTLREPSFGARIVCYRVLALSLKYSLGSLGLSGLQSRPWSRGELLTGLAL